MVTKEFKNYNIYFTFLSRLAKDLNNFYFKKLNKKFSVTNKLKGKGYDPVTSSDKEFEKFIRSKISKKFPLHQIIGEEFGKKRSKSEYSWVIDPIDGTRSFVIGNPTWSNLVSLNYKGQPVMGLANFPILKKYYLNFNDKIAYVYENGKRKKLKVNKKIKFNNAKVAGAFHGWLPFKKQMKIPKVLKIRRFKCHDSLSYANLSEGRLDIVIQCANKIWDIHPLIPIIKASGGIISTWKNQDAVLAGNIVVSNNIENHKKIIRLLQPALK